MKFISALIVGLSLLCVVLSVPSFGTYNCTSAQYPIQNTGVLTQSGRYGVATQVSAGSYEIKQSFNLTAGLLGTVYTTYFTVYTNQTYVLLDLSSNTTNVTATSPALTTCNQTLPAFADEATRVVNIARASNGIIYRNRNLDQAAANLISSGNLTIPQAYASNIAANTTASAFVAGTGVLVNPGSTVQSLISSSVANSVSAAREIGVYYNSTLGQLAYVVASRTIACGNGVVDGNETCDDSNTVSGDGCSSSCQTEGGYSCTQNAFNPVSVCTRIANVSLTSTASASVAASSGTVSPSASTTTSASLIPGVPSNSPSNSANATTVSSSPSTGSSISPSSTTSLSATSIISASPSSPASASSTSGATISPSSTNSGSAALFSSVSPSSSRAASISGSSTNTATASVTAARSVSGSFSSIPSLTSNPSGTASSSPSAFIQETVPPTTGSANTLSTWMKIMF